MFLTETPISVLQKQVNYLDKFIQTLLNKEDIRQDIPQEKIDGLILECELKRKEFEIAIHKLS